MGFLVGFIVCLGWVQLHHPWQGGPCTPDLKFGIFLLNVKQQKGCFLSFDWVK